MILVDMPCDKCIHLRPNIDGWNCACDAFPTGIPDKYLFELDVTQLPECNNGIGYEEKND